MPVPGPGRVAWDGLQQSIATREPNLEPRRETICFLFRCEAVRIVPKSETYTKNVPNMTGHNLTLVRCSIHQDPLNQIVAILISRNWRLLAQSQQNNTNVSHSLSINGIRGRSVRPVHTRLRYRSKNSDPPIFRHFSTIFEAN
jgi:hypothetical protein